MTTAEQILRMIETVDPSDKPSMGRIDRSVSFYLSTGCHDFKLRKYTRSRDALKSIRPKGWTFDFSHFDNGDVQCYAPCPDGEGSREYVGKTEELAELHVIIQSAEHERTTK